MENKSFYFVGIAGGSASGKTSFLEKLKDTFPENQLCIISQDDYYHPLALQKSDSSGIVNYDLPSSIDDQKFLADITKLSKGEAVNLKEYVFNNPGIEPKLKILNPAPIVVVEGLFIFWFEEIASKLDLKIFIDAREDLRFIRRMKRDIESRNIDENMVHHQWNQHVHPSFKRFLLPFREESDIIITNNHNFDKGYEILCHHFESLLKY